MQKLFSSLVTYNDVRVKFQDYSARKLKLNESKKNDVVNVVNKLARDLRCCYETLLGDVISFSLVNVNK